MAMNEISRFKMGMKLSVAIATSLSQKMGHRSALCASTTKALHAVFVTNAGASTPMNRAKGPVGQISADRPSSGAKKERGDIAFFIIF